MKIASFNIQNLFHRDKLLFKENRIHNEDIRIQEFEKLIQTKHKTSGDYSRMHELAGFIGLNTVPFDPYISMKNIDGEIVVSSSFKGQNKKASHRTNWEGWIKLKTAPISVEALMHKAKVILDSNPDILILQEVEDRASLLEFNRRYLSGTNEKLYDKFIHMEGNNPRSLGMGIILKPDYQIKSIKSFANEIDEDASSLFEKDLHQYQIEASNGNCLYILNCHFDAESDTKRKRQALRTCQIYNELLTKGIQNIMVVGTLNAPSYSESLSTLFTNTGLRDVVKHTSFKVDSDIGGDSNYFRLGAYRKGVNIIQKDYLLVPLSLVEKITDSGMNRRAMWPLTLPQWPIYESIKKEVDAASEHPLLWVDLNMEKPKSTFIKSA